MDTPESAEPSRLARRLGTADAVVIGLGSMIGAGVFAAVGPAAEAAGAGLLIGLAVAAAVAYCNATSSAQLAAVYPQSGGTYVYGREQLSAFWGYLAGWAFVVGKLASCAAMALTFGAYAAPRLARPLAVGAVVALAGVNYRGVRKTATLTKVIVALVLASLATVVVAVAAGGAADPARLTDDLTAGGARGILRAAGLLFFAFAGYARIATLGEEVVDPARTIPRAIPLALGITLAVYGVVAATALMAAGPQALAEADAPLAAAVAAGTLGHLTPVVRVGATIASLGVLLSLIVGISRTAFAMADNGDLPRWLAAVHPRYAVPHRAEVAVAVLVASAAAAVDLRQAIGFSSFAVLAYYALANASAFTLAPSQRRWPRPLAAVGVGGCALLALSLPLGSVVTGAAVLGVGALVWPLQGHRRST